MAAQVTFDEDGLRRLTELWAGIHDVARTHKGRPRPEVLAALERVYAAVEYGATDGLDLPELAQNIADGNDVE